jgi:uncharacterized membrane protein
MIVTLVGALILMASPILFWAGVDAVDDERRNPTAMIMGSIGLGVVGVILVLAGLLTMAD